MTRPDWDFDYHPLPTWRADDDGTGCDLVVATRAPVEPGVLVDALGVRAGDAMVEPIVDRSPIFWMRLHLEHPMQRAEVADRLLSAAVPVRYVASSLRPSSRIPPALRIRRSDRATTGTWKARQPFAYQDEDTPSRWFLRREAGIAVDRVDLETGTGRGWQSSMMTPPEPISSISMPSSASVNMPSLPASFTALRSSRSP